MGGIFMMDKDVKQLSEGELFLRLSETLSKDAALQELLARGWTNEQIRETILRVSRLVPRF